MPVMNVRHMRVIVYQMSMVVLVAVWFARRITRTVRVLMVQVVHVKVRVQQLVVLVHV